MLPAGIFLRPNDPYELCVAVSVEVSRHVPGGAIAEADGPCKLCVETDRFRAALSWGLLATGSCPAKSAGDCKVCSRRHFTRCRWVRFEGKTCCRAG